MKRLLSLCGGLLMLAGGSLPAAAQVGGPCSLISDDALSQDLGSSVHSIGIVSNQSAVDGPAVADMCVAQLGGESFVMMTHMVGVQTQDADAALSMSQTGPAAAMFAALDPSVLSTTPIAGLGDSALLLSGTPHGQPYANLIVWQGSQGYSIVGTGLSDPTSLQSIAQTILTNQQ